MLIFIIPMLKTPPEGEYHYSFNYNEIHVKQFVVLQSLTNCGIWFPVSAIDNNFYI